MYNREVHVDVAWDADKDVKLYYVIMQLWISGYLAYAY